MSDLYRADILDHYRNPHNFRSLEPFDVSSEDDNSLCGDRIRIDLRLDGVGHWSSDVSARSDRMPRRSRP